MCLGFYFCSCLVGVPVQPHLPATGWVCWERGVVKEQTGTSETEPLISILFSSTLLLELVCTAEIAALSNYSWKDTVVITVIDAIFGAKNQNWPWT